MLKCISVHQPYASLLSIGAKRYETRNWTSPYRGWVAIHAGKNSDTVDELSHEIADYMENHEPLEGFVKFVVLALKANERTAELQDLRDLPRGAIIGIARLTDCIKGETLLPGLGEQERAFGYFSALDEQRYGWQFEDAMPLPNPIYMTGQQGLFTINEHITQQVRDQWRYMKKGA